MLIAQVNNHGQVFGLNSAQAHSLAKLKGGDKKLERLAALVRSMRFLERYEGGEQARTQRLTTLRQHW